MEGLISARPTPSCFTGFSMHCTISIASSVYRTMFTVYSSAVHIVEKAPFLEAFWEHQ